MSQGANYTVIQTTTDPRIQQAINVIYSTYGHTVSVETKKKNLIKYGRTSAATTSSSTVWDYGGNETYVSSNLIDTISSSDVGDTQTVTIEGHTISGGNKTFVTQTSTLNGRNKVVLSTPLARSTAIYNTGSTNFAGDIYVYEESTITNGVPDTASKVHLMAKAAFGGNASAKCATSLSSVDYWLITGFDVAVLKKTAAFADFSLQIRESSGVFRTVEVSHASNTSGLSIHNFDPFIIARPNSDIRIVCTADAASTDVMADITGVLAIIS